MSKVTIVNNLTTAAFYENHEPAPEYGDGVNAVISFDDAVKNSIVVKIDGKSYFPDQIESLIKAVEKAKRIIELNQSLNQEN